MTKGFAPRGLAFWLMISLMAHLPLGVVFLARWEEQQLGEQRPFTINLAGQATGEGAAAPPIRTGSRASLTPELLRGAAAIPAIPTPEHDRYSAKLPSDTASITAEPVEISTIAEGAKLDGIDAETTETSGDPHAGPSAGTFGSYAPPAYAAGDDPAYPAQARSNGWEGEVWLRVQIAADGSVIRITIERSSRHVELDLAATTAVKRWRFHPASRNGIAVAETVLLPLTFRLSPAQ